MLVQLAPYQAKDHVFLFVEGACFTSFEGVHVTDLQTGTLLVEFRRDCDEATLVALRLLGIDAQKVLKESPGDETHHPS